MVTQRREQFVRAQVTWMVGTVLVLSIVGSLTLERFFAVSIIGLVVLMALVAPVNVAPAWRARLRWLVVAALVAFGGLVVRHVLGILPRGLL